jgi:hypothetical protein
MATSKIPNRKILLGAKLLLAGLCAQLFVTYLGYKGVYTVFVRWEFYPLYLQHLGWSVLAGAVLWYAEIWPAGDAKFFMLISAALPVVLPEIKHFPGNLFLSLLVNIFVLASVFAIGRYVSSEIHTVAPSDSFNSLWAALKGRIAPLFAVGKKTSALAYPFNMTFLFVMQQLVALEVRGEVGRFLARADIFYFFLFLLWDKVGESFRSARWMRVTICCYLVYFFAGYFYFYDHLAGMVVTAIGNVFKFSLLLFFGRFVLSFLMERKDLVYLSAEELKPGMVLSAGAHSNLKGNSHFEGAFDDSFRDGLEEEQLALLKDWLKKLPLECAKIEIVKGRPFALWISAGAALSLLLGRNFAQLLK